ncbi:MAG TPA: NAD-dependent epimerase/dehydratase family protein [Acidisarcina sp.]
MPAVLVTGAAGFLGSHLVDALLAQGDRVIGVDNFLRGTRANLAEAFARGGFELLTADLADTESCNRVVRNLEAAEVQQVWHLAANSDIPAGVDDLNVDLRDTFLSTVGSLRIAKQLGIKHFFFTSTSAVYGEREGLLTEDSGPMQPISNYGAMKLASEAAISAAAEAYLETARVFRLPNVVGARSTHGLIHDMRGKLAASPDRLQVLGDGTQRKQYLHAGELIEAVLWVAEHASGQYEVYNVGPSNDPGITVRRIIEIILETSGSSATAVYTGGDRGWVGDVPRFFYSVEKLAASGWRARGSSESAIRQACFELLGGAPDSLLSAVGKPLGAPSPRGKAPTLEVLAAGKSAADERADEAKAVPL